MILFHISELVWLRTNSNEDKGQKILSLPAFPIFLLEISYKTTPIWQKLNYPWIIFQIQVYEMEFSLKILPVSLKVDLNLCLAKITLQIRARELFGSSPLIIKATSSFW